MRRVAIAILMVVLSVAAKAQATPSSTPQTTPPPAQEEKQEAKTQAVPPSAPPATPSPAEEEKEKMIKGYITHQSIELGGHIVDQSGSTPMYSTLVNIQTGPRILSQSLTMRATDPSHATFFDNLSTSSFGYGGEPINVTVLNVSKGRIYDFRGSYRRARQYFDYNLLANPLIPPNSDSFCSFA